MVRVLLDLCVPDLENPANIYLDENKKRLLLKKGVPLTERTKALLAQNKIKYLEFPLPFERTTYLPYTFSAEIESALFRLVRSTHLGFKENSTTEPTDIRKDAYEILAEAAKDFKKIIRTEQPFDDTPPKRDARSIIHLRTVGALEDYLFEHAKNVALTCLVMAHEYFRDSKQLLAEIHKVSVAGMFADIGMMKIPERILKKDAELTDEEWEKIYKHPEISAQFVQSMFRQKDFITPKIVLKHHERWDGSGYPNEERGVEIGEYVPLLAVTDSYHSMVSKRYFRKAQSPFDAIFTLNQQAKKMYNEKAVRCLNYRIAPYPIGTVARFAENKAIHILELEHVPTDFDKVKIVSEQSRKTVYNTPKIVRAFIPNKNPKSLSKVDIGKHLDEIGLPLDTFDLLVLYGYTKQQ